MRYSYLLLLITLCLSSCKKDEPGPAPATPEKILGIYEFNGGGILSSVKCDDGRLMVLTQSLVSLSANTITGVDEKGKLWFRNDFEEEDIHQYFSIAEAPDNGIILAGGRNFGLPSSLGLLHFDKNGQRLWSLETGFDDPNNQVKFLDRTYDGNYVAMDTRLYSAGSLQYRFVWFTPGGVVLRTKQVEISGEIYWQDLNETPDHGYLCTGYRRVSSGDGGEWVVVKFTDQGSVQWQQSLPGTLSSAQHAIGLDDGSVIACGRLVYTDSQDGLLVHISATGDMLSQKTFTLSHNTKFDAIVQDGNGGYTLLASVTQPGSAPGVMLLSVSADGTEQWRKSYDITAGGHRVFKRSDGGYTILANDITGNGRFFVIITDKDGNMD